jgi:hypothetical protein
MFLVTEFIGITLGKRIISLRLFNLGKLVSPSKQFMKLEILLYCVKLFLFHYFRETIRLFIVFILIFQMGPIRS